MGAGVQGRRFGAIDCGTNSIRLLIGEVVEVGGDVAPEIKELNRDNIIVRLGQGVDATGRFAPEALERVREALEVYVERMLEYGVEDVMMGATSATRDAANRDEFFAMTAELLGRVREGAQAEVISGEKEAELSFAGAVMDLPAGQGPFHENVCVIDLGGGSTEFVLHGPGREPQAFSADMGCVRITEKFLHTEPPTSQEIAGARTFVSEWMKTVREHVDLGAVDRVVGVAGTMTTMAAIAKGMDSYDPTATHMARLPLETIRDVAHSLLAATPTQRLNHGPMHPGRADVIGGGAVVVDAFTSYFLDRGLVEITVSEKDILDGILAEVIRRNA
ncbi:MAG TPA: Ppx/GppA family phosphatase [Candidatus Corynebacterium gallistercoris]|uniref:Ppx/GppA family phosphatase n=1 Tax=Candidatus Corynebacterium gallistercoris TaxID=2838530 RepID=A0A9D1S039_9CORY|nr:Ppx/GppA family phosphatase [Candidatus Corynebacterium gallistercoris]